MKVKKYIASTMPEAMNQVKKELGESAVILDSREIKTSRFFGLFGKRNIEVLAAVDPKPTRIRQSSREKKQTANDSVMPTKLPMHLQKSESSREKVSTRLPYRIATRIRSKVHSNSCSKMESMKIHVRMCFKYYYQRFINMMKK